MLEKDGFLVAQEEREEGDINVGQENTPKKKSVDSSTHRYGNSKIS